LKSLAIQLNNPTFSTFSTYIAIPNSDCKCKSKNCNCIFNLPGYVKGIRLWHQNGPILTC